MSSKKLHSFSPDGNSLAICQPNGILRIWNTSSNVLVHEFQPSEHLKASTTCLSYSKPFRKRKQTKKKKKQHNDEPMEHQPLIAMGTISGTTYIYNPSLQELISTLDGSDSSILDMAWESDAVLVTLAENGVLTYWDAIKSKKLRYFKVGKNNSLCLISRNQLIVASMGIKLLNLDSDPFKEHCFTGHKNKVTHLLPISLEKEDSASHFLSAAEEERFLYAWSTTCESHDPVASFSLNDTVKSISSLKLDDTSVAVIVITKKGHLQYFSHHLNGVKRKKPLKSSLTLRIELDGASEAQFIPIIAAYFLSKDVIVFTYGSELYLRSEKINTSSLNERTLLKRTDPSLSHRKKESKLLNTITPHIPNEAVHLTPSFFSENQQDATKKRKRGDSTLHMPMEERLSALSINKHSALQKGPLVSDNVHLLMQGVHSKDSRLLYSVLMKGENEEVVDNTVRNLPVQCIVPLLQSLQEFLMGKGLKNLALINWIKSLLVHHMSHLSTLPNKESILNPFQAMSSARMTTLPEVTKLHSRLNLLLTHVTSRHDNASKKQAQQDPLLLYREESDEEQENRMETTLFSESEDIGDDSWSEDEMDEDDEDFKSSGDASEMTTGSYKNGPLKRSASPDEALIVSTTDEEEQEEMDQQELTDEEGEESDSDQMSGEESYASD